MVINQWNITLFFQQKQIIWMQRARHDFIIGKQDISDSMWRWQRSALAQHSGVHFTTDYTCMIVYVTNNKEPWVHRFVNFVVYYFELFGTL